MYTPLIHDKSNLKNLYLRFGLVLFINLLAYGIGCFITGKGLASGWYNGLEKTSLSPGIFTIGFGWLLSLFCFSAFLFYAWDKTEYRKYLIGIFIVHWILNFTLDLFFFNNHWVFTNLLLMSGLALLLIGSVLLYSKEMKAKTALLVPYLLWICFLISQNLFIYQNN